MGLPKSLLMNSFIQTSETTFSFNRKYVVISVEKGGGGGGGGGGGERERRILGEIKGGQKKKREFQVTAGLL